jgi:hypothetical protein
MSKKIWTICALGTIFIFGICIFLFWTRQSSVGVITEGTAPPTPTPGPGDSGSRFSTNCFTVTMPWVTRNQKSENSETDCSFQTRVISPPGRLVIWARKTITAVSEDSGVMMRRRETDTYTEKERQSAAYGKILQFQSEDELTLFFTKDGYIVSASWTNVVTDKLTESDLNSLVESIMMTPGQT